MHTHVRLTNKRRTHAQSNCTNTKLKAWFRRLLRHPARKRSAPILHPRTPTFIHQIMVVRIFFSKTYSKGNFTNIWSFVLMWLDWNKASGYTPYGVDTRSVQCIRTHHIAAKVYKHGASVRRIRHCIVTHGVMHSCVTTRQPHPRPTGFPFMSSVYMLYTALTRTSYTLSIMRIIACYAPHNNIIVFRWDRRLNNHQKKTRGNPVAG